MLSSKDLRLTETIGGGSEFWAVLVTTREISRLCYGLVSENKKSAGYG